MKIFMNKTISSFIKDLMIVCSSKSLINNNPPDDEYDALKDQYRLLYCIVILDMITKLIIEPLLINNILMISYMINIIFLISLLYLLKIKKINLFNIIFIIYIDIIPLFYLIHNQHCITITHIVFIIIIYPIIINLIFQSYIIIIINWVYSIIFAFMIINMKLIIYIKKTTTMIDIIEYIDILSYIIVQAGSMLLIIMIIYMKSRDNILMKMFNHINELKKINEQLKQNIEVKNSFLLSVSHELRNPLNSVLGNIELALLNLKEGKLYEQLQNCKCSGEILLHLINNLLDSGKMENNTLDIVNTPLNIQKFIEKIWATTKILIQKKNLMGELYYSINIPDQILCDAHRIMQIMFNIVGNAAKFTNHGYVKVIVSWESIQNSLDKILTPTQCDNQYNMYCSDLSPEEEEIFHHQGKNNNIANSNNQNEDYVYHEANSINLTRQFDVRTLGIVNSGLYTKKKSLSKEKPGFFKLGLDSDRIEINENEKRQINCSEGYLKFEIIDTGCGISKDSIKQLFKKFGQNGNLAQRKMGTGLGLWLSRQLCRKMNGDIKAYSKENFGSIFIFAIKCKVSDKLNQQVISSNESDKKEYRALVVDDDKINQEIIKSFVEKCGVNVTNIASNGEIALDIYKCKGKGYFDFVFMDLDMPIMNGKTASLKIREYEKILNWEPTTLIIVSGNYMEEEVNECLNLNGPMRANYFYPKPFTLNHCKNLLANIVDKKTNHRYDRYSSSKVLVVDDDIFNSKILCEFLARFGIKSLTAMNGKEALKKVQDNHQDICMIFMDCEMPIMNGIEATKAIKNYLYKNKLNDIPIYGLTGHEGKEYHQICYDAGMIKVLIKPISSETLKAVL